MVVSGKIHEFLIRAPDLTTHPLPIDTFGPINALSSTLASSCIITDPLILSPINMIKICIRVTKTYPDLS